jgi:hypothetical protein
MIYITAIVYKRCSFSFVCLVDIFFNNWWRIQQISRKCITGIINVHTYSITKYKRKSIFYQAGINICVDSNVQMYVIKGKRNFNYFINNGLWCEDCFEKTGFFFKITSCVTALDFKFISYSVLDTDEYYIVYLSTDDDTWLIFAISINKYINNYSDGIWNYQKRYHVDPCPRRT